CSSPLLPSLILASSLPPAGTSPVRVFAVSIHHADALHSGNSSLNRSKSVVSAFAPPHCDPKHRGRRILGCATGLVGAFGGRDHEPAAISNSGGGVLSNRCYRRLGFRQPYRL